MHGRDAAAPAGFLEGRRATTHWGAKQELRDLGGNTEVVDAGRWVVDGNVITAAGVSAGIDMALYVVGPTKVAGGRAEGAGVHGVLPGAAVRHGTNLT